MSDIPSTLTDSQWQEIVKCKNPMHGSLILDDNRALIKEVKFLRGLIGDLSQDGQLEVYNRGKSAGWAESTAWMNRVTVRVDPPPPG